MDPTTVVVNLRSKVYVTDSKAWFKVETSGVDGPHVYTFFMDDFNTLCYLVKRAIDEANDLERGYCEFLNSK